MSEFISAWAVPDVILQRTDLEMTDKVLIAILYRLGATEKTIFPRHEWLAKQMGINEKTIRRSLIRLRELGLVTFEGRRWKINQYSVSGQSVQLSPDRESSDSLDSKSTHNKHNKVNITKIPIASDKSPAVVEVEKPKKEKKPDDSKDPLSLAQFVATCAASKSRHIQVIGNFADEAKYSFTTKGQWRLFIQRNIRPARQLSEFTDEQIAKALKKMYKDQKERPGFLEKWGLETIIKYLK